MKLSLSWLRRYADVPATRHELDAALTAVGLELDGYEDPGAGLTGLIVGEVRTRDKHPNADKLSVCTVFDGSEEHTVVCGAANVAAGQKIVFAPVGAYLPVVDITIGRRALRGIESAGMICSAREIGMGDDHSGILVLDPAAIPGTPILDHFELRGDATLEIGITPNRGDALSHVGVARDLAAATGTPLRMPVIDDILTPGINGFTVRIDDPDLCPRYSCAIVRGVRPGPSPRWMQRSLERSGIRPISAIVDVTNYVMLEIGQPMHAFDLRSLQDSTIIVRAAGEEERFTTLDGREHMLPSRALLICDAARPVALAGIMGGANSGITDGTTDVLLESACFHPSSIRATARALGMSTDSSYRFERGTDIDRTVWALQRAAGLLREIADGTADGFIDCYPDPAPEKWLTLDPLRTHAVLGIEIPAEEQARILAALQFDVRLDGGQIKCRVPGFRTDVERDIDLIEEVIRIYGYDHIPTPERVEIHSQPRPDDDALVGVVRSALIGMGYDEILSSTLVSAEHAALCAPDDKIVRVLNPVSTERPCLRPSLLPSLLETVDRNLRNGTSDIHLFEIGSVMQRVSGGNAASLDGYLEEQHVGICLAGLLHTREWYGRERSPDFYDIKGAVEALTGILRLDNAIRFVYDAQTTLTNPALRIEADGIFIGSIMEIGTGLLKQFDIDQPVMVAELSITALQRLERGGTMVERVSRFPVVRRDLAVVVKGTVLASDVTACLTEERIPDLTSIRIVDVFEHESLGSGMKSLAISLAFQSPDRTLTDTEISERMSRALAALTRKVQAELRT